MDKNNIVRVWIGDPYKDGKFNGTASLVNGHTLITAKHVVSNKQGKIYEDIYFTDMPNGGVVPVDEVRLCERDIAILTIKKYFPITAILQTDDLCIGSNVEIHGFHDSKGDRGCKKHLVSGYLNNTHTFELQNHLSGGFSGSPVFLDNKLCGITQAIHPKKNITYIIPISECCDKSIFEEQESTDSYNSQKLKNVKELFKRTPIDLLKIKAYKYLPISYLGKLGDSNDAILDKLLEIGRLKEQCIPILSVLEEIENERHHDDIVALIQYLKNIKFSDISEYQCSENMAISELSLLINFVLQDGKESFKLEIWRYSNGETHKILEDIKEINLDNPSDISSLLDVLYAYCQEAILIYKSKIFIEIVLPTERLYQNIKKWEDSNGMSLIRKYKYLFRLQSRFIKPDNTWKSKWDEMDLDTTYLNLDDVSKSKFIEAKSYSGEIASSNYSVILKEEISNPNYLFEDVKEFGIPIVLSSLSEECNIGEVKNFKFKDCREDICTHMMSNHTSCKSDMFFMIDNPNKIPEEFKKPEQNLYGW